eukprot:scaffold20687_cov112-Isochrysis_galbana.AAC.1
MPSAPTRTSPWTAVVIVLVRVDRRCVPHVLLRPGQQNCLQVGPVDYTRKRHAADLGWCLEIEPGVPLVAHAVLDAVGPVAGPRGARRHLAVQLRVDGLELAQRVGGQLDRPAEPLELRGALENRVGDRRTPLGREVQVVGQRQAAHARAGDEHVQWLGFRDDIGTLRRARLRRGRRRGDGGLQGAGSGAHRGAWSQAAEAQRRHWRGRNQQQDRAHGSRTRCGRTMEDDQILKASQ